MKRLIVMRHAKATHRPGFADADRPLTGRGRRDAAAAGAWLRGRQLIPGQAVCSASRRTRETWESLAPAVGPELRAVARYDPRLYQADADTVIEIIGCTPDDVAALLLVGHNPAVQQVACSLTGSADLVFPTSALAVISLASWARLMPGAGTAEAFWSPGSGGQP